MYIIIANAMKVTGTKTTNTVNIILVWVSLVSAVKEPVASPTVRVSIMYWSSVWRIVQLRTSTTNHKFPFSVFVVMLAFVIKSTEENAAM